MSNSLSVCESSCAHLPFCSCILAPSQGPRSLEVALTSSSSIDIQWSHPDVDQSNGQIQYYSIELFNMESGDILTFSTPETSLSIIDLHPYYNYNVSVAAVTVDEGVKSTFVFQMPEDGKLNNVLIPFSSYYCW